MRKLKLIILLLLIPFFSIKTQNVTKYRVVAVSFNKNVISVSNTISVVKPLRLYAPNVFSPDGDGINDHFEVKGVGIEEFDLEIYNRWGQLVYKSDTLLAWNGEYRNRPVPMGTYVYQVRARNYDGSDIIVKDGTVTLVR